MKNKKFIYLLGLAVVAVWGLIFYTMFASGPEHKVVTRTGLQFIKEEPAIDFPPDDSIRNRIIPRDPFYGVVYTHTPAASREVEFEKSIVKKEAAVNWNVVQYSGYIRNPVTKNHISILTINGRERMLNDGETADGILLLKNNIDSVRVRYLGETRFIKLK